VKLLQSENWLVGHYWNWKQHRYEVSIMEFYEKEMDWEAKTFSSRTTPHLDVVSQSYVFPTGISTMGVTETAHGITTKQVLCKFSWYFSLFHTDIFISKLGLAQIGCWALTGDGSAPGGHPRNSSLIRIRLWD